jgi:hypothetical protein
MAEGIFYRDDVTNAQSNVLKRYKNDPPTLPEIEHFPAQTQLILQNRASFVCSVFWKSVRKGDLIVGFNLPFDLSRLAVKSTEGKKGDWSLALSQLWKNPKTGRVVPNPKRPRIVVDAQNSKMAFMRLGSILHKEEWPKEGRFLDLRTLAWAIRNASYNLEGACKDFNVKGKLVDYKPSGRISAEELEYCRRDVAASHRLLNATMEEFNRNPVDLHPDKAYSPASIAKAYLNEMRIKKPRQHFRAPNKMLGIAMQSYYGGRAECRIRKTPVPVIHTDFTSQYPTVNALLGNWNVLKSASVRFVNCTAKAKKLLSQTNLDDKFDPALWKQLSFFALVKPDGDILPVRTVYSDTGKTQNIGRNYLSSETPIWYAGPDLVASKILTGKTPRILKALEMVSGGRQNRLRSTNLGGMVKIKPAEQDFYCEVVQKRAAHKKTEKSLADFLKVLANSGSYGLFVEVNTEMKKKERQLVYFSGEKKGAVDSNYAEKPGAWYFPPIASLITSGGKLLLAMLEKSVDEKGGSYLFCDTDSLCIVGTEKGSFVACVGGKTRHHGKSGFRAIAGSGAPSQCQSANPSDGDPGPSDVGGRTHGACERGPRVDEILWCTTAEMRERANGSGDRQRTEPGVAGRFGPAACGNRITQRRIAEYDRGIARVAKEVYPQVALLQQVKGVGTLIALTYVLTLDDPHRFRRSRDAGCFVGLRPGRRNSGMSEPQMHISKEGDRYLRTLLVQGAHYILGPFGQDSDLRRWGLKLAERGGKNAKKRAVVGVARKLAVLLHKLWVSGEVYEPLRNNHKVESAAA